MTDPHQHYVRRYDGYAGSAPGPWVPAGSAIPARSSAPRRMIMIGVILLITAVIVLAAVYAGDAAATDFGPLIPSPTPHPEGWTYAP